MLTQDIEVFLHDYAPCTVDTAKVCDCLKSLCILGNPILATTETGSYRWLPALYSSKEESSALKDDVGLRPLRNIINSIHENMNHGIQLCPELRMGSDVLEGDLIKGCFIDEKSSSRSISHEDMIVPLLKMHEKVNLVFVLFESNTDA